MKVAQFIGECGPGGAETIAFSLARDIADDVKIPSIVYVKNISDAEWCESRLDNSKVAIQVLPNDVMRYWGVKDIWKFALAFRNQLRKDGITVLHSHMYPQIVRGSLAAMLAGVGSIGTLHDVYSIQEKPNRIRWLKMATWIGTQLVTVSNHMNMIYHKISRDYPLCKLPKDNPVVVYNGVNTEKFYPRECEDEKKVGLNLISVGRLADVKNYSLLLSAMHRAIEGGHEHIYLTLIGDGEKRDELEFLAEKYLDGHVTFLGVREDVNELLCQADMFVLPSKSEGLSCSIQEAMASGLPILASNVGGNPELVNNNVNGILFPSDDTETLARELEHLSANKYRLKSMGMESRRIIDDMFSFDEMSLNYIRLYARHGLTSL